MYLIGSSVKSPSDIKMSIVGPSVRPSVGSLATSIPITGAAGLLKKNNNKRKQFNKSVTTTNL
jgi:hypothetical protein